MAHHNEFYFSFAFAIMYTRHTSQEAKARPAPQRHVAFRCLDRDRTRPTAPLLPVHTHREREILVRVHTSSTSHQKITYLLDSITGKGGIPFARRSARVPSRPSANTTNFARKHPH